MALFIRSARLWRAPTLVSTAATTAIAVPTVFAPLVALLLWRQGGRA